MDILDKPRIEEKVKEASQFDTIGVYLQHKDAAGRTVAHVLAHQIQPDLAVYLYEVAHPAWMELVNTQTMLTRTPGGWTPLHCRTKP